MQQIVNQSLSGCYLFKITTHGDSYLDSVFICNHTARKARGAYNMHSNKTMLLYDEESLIAGARKFINYGI